MSPSVSDLRLVFGTSWDLTTPAKKFYLFLPKVLKLFVGNPSKHSSNNLNRAISSHLRENSKIPTRAVTLQTRLRIHQSQGSFSKGQNEMSSRGLDCLAWGGGSWRVDNQSHWGVGGFYKKCPSANSPLWPPTPQSLEPFKSNGSRIHLHGV